MSLGYNAFPLRQTRGRDRTRGNGPNSEGPSRTIYAASDPNLPQVVDSAVYGGLERARSDSRNAPEVRSARSRSRNAPEFRGPAATILRQPSLPSVGSRGGEAPQTAQMAMSGAIPGTPRGSFQPPGPASQMVMSNAQGNTGSNSRARRNNSPNLSCSVCVQGPWEGAQRYICEWFCGCKCHK